MHGGNLGGADNGAPGTNRFGASNVHALAARAADEYPAIFLDLSYLVRAASAHDKDAI